MRLQVVWFGWCVQEQNVSSTLESLRSILFFASNASLESNCRLSIVLLGSLLPNSHDIALLIKSISRLENVACLDLTQPRSQRKCKFDFYYAWLSHHREAESKSDFVWTIDGDICLPSVVDLNFFHETTRSVLVTEQIGDRRHHPTLDLITSQTLEAPLGACSGGSVIWREEYLRWVLVAFARPIYSFVSACQEGYLIDDVILFDIIQRLQNTSVFFTRSIVVFHPWSTSSQKNHKSLLKQWNTWLQIISE